MFTVLGLVKPLSFDQDRLPALSTAGVKVAPLVPVGYH